MKATEKQKAYSKQWYLANKNKHRETQRKHREELRQLIRAAKSKLCSDCRTQYPWYVMQFDHLPQHNKICAVGRVQSLGLTRIEQEIAKCEVVCANCHMERTHRRKIVN